MNPVERKLRRTSLACVILVALLAGSIAFLHPVTPLDRKILDAQFSLARSASVRPLEGVPEVVIVGIDSRSAAAIPEPMTLLHAPLGRFLEGMRVAKAALVAIDVVLPERSYEAVLPGVDAALVRGLLVSRAAFPTVLAQTVDEAGERREIYRAFVAAAGVTPGYALWREDPDGVIRRFDERLGQLGESVPTFAGQIARALGKSPHDGYIDYASGSALNYIPFIDVLERIGRADEEGLRRLFEGKVVFLGSVLPLTDLVRLPVALAAWGPGPDATPGVLLQAHAARLLLAERMISPAPTVLVALLSVLAALAAGLVARPVASALVALAVVAGVVFASQWSLGQGLFLPITIVVVATAGGWTARQGVLVVHRLLERHRLRASFSGYVSPAVMDAIVRGSLSPAADGEQRYVCLMFSDIRGYTTRSQGMKPAEVLAFLNKYFDGVVGIIHGHGGTVVCFMGDGIMAVFGAPQGLDNPCESAFLAARAMLDNLVRTNERLCAEGMMPIDIGIGLHAGEAVLGHVGGKQRHDYSAIGDVTNVASRLESSSKEVGYRVVLSDEVAAQLSDRSCLVDLGPVDLKGHTPVAAHGFSQVAAAPEAVR